MTGVRVLVVDDQPVYRAAMTSVVEETSGFQVIGQAVSGEDALAVASGLQPDLVLLDVNLPGIDGAETARRLLSQARHAVEVCQRLGPARPCGPLPASPARRGSGHHGRPNQPQGGNSSLP